MAKQRAPLDERHGNQMSMMTSFQVYSLHSFHALSPFDSIHNVDGLVNPSLETEVVE